MHVLGKVLAFLVVIAAAVAGIFTSKLVAVRNSWTIKVAQSKDKYAKTTAEIEKQEAIIDRLTGEYSRSQDLWGNAPNWNNVPTAIADPATGTLQVSIGSNSGVRQDLMMHGFEIQADGSSIFRGSFLPVEVRDVNASLRPSWRATADDISQWQPGNWRWRNALPSGYQENFDRQLLAILKLEETLADRKLTLSIEQDLLEKENQFLKLREAELLGGDLLEGTEGADPEFRDGLVAAVEQAEEDRNKSLVEVDDLRHKVRSTQAEIERLQAENTELVKRLPQPTTQTVVPTTQKLSQPTTQSALRQKR